jgi:hypothetical protein
MGHSLFASLYDLELAATIRGGFDRGLGCGFQCCIKQFADGPRALSYAQGFGGSAADACARRLPNASRIAFLYGCQPSVQISGSPITRWRKS